MDASVPGDSVKTGHMPELNLQIQKGDFRLEVSQQFPAEGVTAIFGPSGSGKSTLLRSIAGLDPAQGKIRIKGQSWLAADQALPPHQRPVGMVFQEARLFPHLNVDQNLRFAWQDDSPVSPNDLVNQLGLESLLQRLPSELSGGQQQRVALGRAILSNPQILLLDEPLSALDQQSKTEILPFLERSIRDLGIPVLYVTHDSGEVVRLADHLALLEEGKVAGFGSVAEMLADLDQSLALRPDADTLIEGEVSHFDEEYHLSTVTFSGGSFQVAEALEAGREVRLRIFARDVSLANEIMEGSSILNRFPARITQIREVSLAQVMVRLDAGGTPLLARLTRKSANALDLHPGRECIAQVKSVALIGG